jgi:hypothetical protein
MSGEAFTKSTTDDFNLDDWISGARLPEKSVTVYGRADLVAEFYELEQQVRAADSDGVEDDRLTGDPKVALAQRMETLREQMQSSALTFRFRALLSSEAAKREDGKTKPTDEELTYANLSIQAVTPKVKPEQWPQIRERIGEGQFGALLEAAGSASYDRQVTVPFSLASSALLARKDS